MSSVPILPGSSDERLLELIVAGEERAFEMVVRRYRASLVGYCRRIGLTESRAEDAVQQCFLSALLALRRGDEVRDLRAWLGRIAHNVAVNMMRSGSASRELAGEWAVEERAIHIPDMDGGLAAREALAEVAALPAMQREALLQSALGGRSYGEVAASMGVSEGAVRGLLHRARQTLRAAAAAISPFPLMRRISGWGGPSAGRALEMTVPGGSTALSGTAARAVGAGLAAIVLAAGVAVVPHGSGHARSHPAAKLPAVHGAASSATTAAAAASSGEGTKLTADRGSGGSSRAGGVTHGATTGQPGTIVLKTSGGSTVHHRETTLSTQPHESSGGTVTLSTGPAQASSVAPTGSGSESGSGTVTQPPPTSGSPGEKEKESEELSAQKFEAEAREREKAEEAREREAEEAAERAREAKEPKG